MVQLHCYVPDAVAVVFKEKAKQAHLTTSKYLALLVKKEAGQEWPEDYFDLFGSWQGDPIQRPKPLDFEERIKLK